MKKIYVIRHGETLFNRYHMMQGSCDSPLTKTGKKQALKAKEYFEKNNIVFDHAYTSTSERAIDTLEIITDVAYTRMKELKEMDFGRLEGQRDIMCPNDKSKFDTFFVEYGGESVYDMLKRVKSGFDKIFKSDYEKILVVTHGAVMMNLYRHIVDKNYKFDKALGNCSIFEFDYDQKFEFKNWIDHDFSDI
ncbi:MAG: histidine phosphatase family protein [Tissierellia bacterium]|nr:histidine phosphatase family protein [Tissierellia bacterium]